MRNWQLIRDKKLDPELFHKRARILDLMREWFKKEGFLEVETPLMVKYPGMEPDLDVFSTEFISKDGKFREKRYFHTSPEYAMKKLLGAGFQKIFQITKTFRNGEWIEESITRHNPEFTMIEWYRANTDYSAIMKDTEAMIQWISYQLPASKDLRECLAYPWQRLSVREAFQHYAKIDLDRLRDLESLHKAVQRKKYVLTTEYSWDDLFFLIMLNEVEPHLGKDHPTFLYDYPASQAALSKKKSDDPFWAERFELYIYGVELCNAFTELTDPAEQRARLVEEQKLRQKLGKEVFPIDEDFLEALETMPPSGGNALGIDRLVMVMLEKKSIEEVLLFPWGD